MESIHILFFMKNPQRFMYDLSTYSPTRCSKFPQPMIICVSYVYIELIYYWWVSQALNGPLINKPIGKAHTSPSCLKTALYNLTTMALSERLDYHISIHVWADSNTSQRMRITKYSAPIVSYIKEPNNFEHNILLDNIMITFTFLFICLLCRQPFHPTLFSQRAWK